MPNILHISPNFNYACGVSRYVYLLLKHYNSREDYKVSFITNGGTALERLNEINLKPHIIKFNTGLRNVIYYNDNIHELSEICKDEKIDIIHSHHRYPEFLASKMGGNIKTISTCHSFVNGFKSISFKSDKLIAVSNAVKAQLVNDFNIKEDKVKILHNFIEEPKINCDEVNSLKKQLGLTPNHYVFFFAGRASKIKGLKYLVEAFNMLKNDYQNVVLLLVSPDDINLQELIQENPYRIIHQKPVNDIYPFLALSNAVVLPSLRDPFPYLMLEAGIMKKTFIGSRVDGIAEFIENGITGLLSTPEDSGSLYFQMKRCYENRILSEKISNSLYDKVKLNSKENYFHKLDSIYKELLIGR